ncbi:hypothetical protein CN613_25510 [Bacillus pseudomycoides]|uniref:Uncharacterized protein n=1 Tax=Bacillus pseudomycoides TaxID=64104 RepID=A0A2A8BYP3_9BACI|nr:hypothetical protein [Bacillus pseudomycoides]PEM65304.1 hypothetical protein CN613_25510 [Bacillus pseudomycoides]
MKEYSVTLVMNNGREIEYIHLGTEMTDVSIIRDDVQKVLLWDVEPMLAVDKDISVRKEHVSYFKVAELEDEEEELEGKARY